MYSFDNYFLSINDVDTCVETVECGLAVLYLFATDERAYFVVDVDNACSRNDSDVALAAECFEAVSGECAYT